MKSAGFYAFSGLDPGSKKYHSRSIREPWCSQIFDWHLAKPGDAWVAAGEVCSLPACRAGPCFRVTPFPYIWVEPNPRSYGTWAADAH